MQIKWLSHIKDQAAKDEFKETLQNSKLVLDKLSEIVYTTIKNRTSVTRSDYDCASWSYKQAHLNGYEECARDLLSLLDLREK